MEQRLISFRTGTINSISSKNGYVTIKQNVAASFIKSWELPKIGDSGFSSLIEMLFGISNINIEYYEQKLNLLLPVTVTYVMDAKDNSKLIAIGNPETKEFFYLETKEVLSAEKIFYSFKSLKERKIAKQIQKLSKELIEVSEIQFSLE